MKKANTKKKYRESWDLSELYKGADDPKISKDLATLKKRAENFEKKHIGKFSKYVLTKAISALKEYSALAEKLHVLGSYAGLSFALNSADPRINSLYQKVQTELNGIENHFVFVPLDLAKNKHLAQFAKSAEARPFNIIFWQLLEIRKHQLTRPEEKAINIKNLTAAAGWKSLREKVEAGLEIKFKDGSGKLRKFTLAEALNFGYSPKRQERIRSYEAVSAALKNNRAVSAHIYNMLLLNKAREDILRSWPKPESKRPLMRLPRPCAKDMAWFRAIMD